MRVILYFRCTLFTSFLNSFQTRLQQNLIYLVSIAELSRTTEPNPAISTSQSILSSTSINSDISQCIQQPESIIIGTDNANSSMIIDDTSVVTSVDITSATNKINNLDIEPCITHT